jgi:hypothetical protein
VTTAPDLVEVVRRAWATIPAPPAEDLEYVSWGWGEKAAQAFEGVAPVDVDRRSEGFQAATPLLDLPPRAAAAYLGPYLISLLEGIEFQRSVGIFTDVVTRAHTLAALTLPSFWERVIRPCLPPAARDAVKQTVEFLASPSAKELLALSDEDARTMLTLAADTPTASGRSTD